MDVRPDDAILTPGHPLWEGSVLALLGQGAGGGMAWDSSPYRNHGTMQVPAAHGITHLLGRNFVTFESNAEGITIPNGTWIDIGSGPVSITLWVHVTSGSSCYLVNTYQSAGGKSFNVHYDTNEFNAFFDDGSVSPNALATKPAYIDTLRHVCGVRDGNDAKIFIDGTLITTANSGSLGDITSDQDVTIGAKASNTSSERFIGHLADVMIHRRVLSNAEIRTLASPDPMYDGALTPASRSVIPVTVPDGVFTGDVETTTTWTPVESGPRDVRPDNAILTPGHPLWSGCRRAFLRRGGSQYLDLSLYAGHESGTNISSSDWGNDGARDAVSTNGSNSYFASGFTQSGDFSIVLGVTPVSIADYKLFTGARNASAQVCYLGCMADGTLWCRVDSASHGAADRFSSAVLASGTLSRICMTYSTTGGIKAYHNGQSVLTASSDTGAPYATPEFWFGGGNNNGSLLAPLATKFSDCLYFSRALTPGEAEVATSLDPMLDGALTVAGAPATVPAVQTTTRTYTRRTQVPMVHSGSEDVRPDNAILTPGHPLWSGCVLALLGQHAGGGTAWDSSPFGNHGTLVGATSAPVFDRQGWYFNGTSNHKISLPSITINPQQQWTVAARHRLDAVTTTRVLWGNSATAGENYIGVLTTGGNVYSESSTPGDQAKHSYATDTQSHSLIFVFDGGSVSLHQDGSLVAAVDGTMTGTALVVNQIGLAASSSYDYLGHIADVIILEHAASESEIRTLASPDPMYGGALTAGPRTVVPIRRTITLLDRNDKILVGV